MKIIKDTREKAGKGFTFAMHDCEVIRTKLDTGDYSIDGYETDICIERKATTSEIATNITGPRKKRLVAEFERMAEFEHAYLICEFSIHTLLAFPVGSTIPEYKWFKKGKNGKKVSAIRLNGKYILSFLRESSEMYDFELIFCDSSSEAEDTAYSILKEYYESQR